MKTCTKCNKKKIPEEFRKRSKNYDGLSCWCNECFREYERNKWKSSKDRRESNKTKNKERILRNRQFIFDWLKRYPCETCGEKDPIVLQFDHINKNEKSHNISEMIHAGFSIEKIKEEVQKCQVLCANCHARRTAKQFGWYKDLE